MGGTNAATPLPPGLAALFVAAAIAALLANRIFISSSAYRDLLRWLGTHAAG